mmetsp:Transcript_1090/g.3048  ORF Transcript_1090/g.3048 Transcript_1090/m.3048 type:complete len:93 (+) Transcript_1090:152-430(+)
MVPDMGGMEGGSPREVKKEYKFVLGRKKKERRGNGDTQRTRPQRTKTEGARNEECAAHSSIEGYSQTSRAQGSASLLGVLGIVKVELRELAE